MKSLSISFHTESPRFYGKDSTHQPRLLCGGLLPLLVAPSIQGHVKINHRSPHSCPPTPLPLATTPTKKYVNNHTRPQSALFRQQIPTNIPTNEIAYFGEDSLLGYQPSISEFGEWVDEPIEIFQEESPRPKLDLGLKGNPVSYSPRSKNRIAKSIHKPEPEPEPNIYRFIPDSHKYQLQEHSLHSVRPEKLLGKEMKRRTMDFVLIGHKKDFKGNEESENLDKKQPQKAFQTTASVSKKSTDKPPTSKSPKPETMQSLNLNRIDLKIEEDTKYSNKKLNLIIPLPAAPQGDNRRRNLIGRTGIRKFGLSNAVRPNYASNIDTFKCLTNKDNFQRRSPFSMSRPHSVIA